MGILLAEGLAFHLLLSKSVTRREMKRGERVCPGRTTGIQVVLAWFKTQSLKERFRCLVFASNALWLLSDRNPLSRSPPWVGSPD